MVLSMQIHVPDLVVFLSSRKLVSGRHSIVSGRVSWRMIGRRVCACGVVQNLSLLDVDEIKEL